jgi:hypothetical protein
VLAGFRNAQRKQLYVTYMVPLSPLLRKHMSCKPHLLQAVHLASHTSCKPRILQAAHPASRTTCKQYILRAAPASCVMKLVPSTTSSVVAAKISALASPLIFLYSGRMSSLPPAVMPTMHTTALTAAMPSACGHKDQEEKKGRRKDRCGQGTDV